MIVFLTTTYTSQVVRVQSRPVQKILCLMLWAGAWTDVNILRGIRFSMKAMADLEYCEPPGRRERLFDVYDMVETHGLCGFDT